MKFESSSSRKKSTFGFQPRFPSLLLASTLLSGALCGWLAWRVLLSSRSLGAGETAAVFAVFGLITAVWLWTVLSLQKSRKIILANDAVREKAKAARFEAEQYRNLFNYANDAILIFEPETETILETNDKACEIYGRRREDFVGRSLKEMSQNVGQGSEELKKLLHDGAYDEFESIHLRADGHAMNLVINAAVIEYQGKMAILTINRDVTAAKRAEAAVRESERNYRLLAEGIKHQVWTSLPDGKLDYVNERTLNYFGRTIKEAINDGWLDVVHPDDLPGCVEHWTRALETGEDYEVEFRLKAADGAYRWHAGRATAGRDADGRIVKWFGTNTDIHEQKLKEELQRNFALLQSAFEAAAGGILVVNAGNKIETFNRQFAEMWNLSDDALKNLHSADTPQIVLEQIKNQADYLEKTRRIDFRDDAVYSDEVELNDGRIFERQSRPQILDEKVIGRVFNFREITEQKRAQKKLRESEEWLKALLDASRDGILVEDDGIIAYVNRAYAEQLKYDAPEELVGRSVADILPPAEVERLSEYGRQRLRGETPPSFYQFTGLCKDKTTVEVEGAVSTYVIGGRKYILTAMRDITERKEAEKALRESEHKLRTLLENMTEGLLQVNETDCIQFVNKSFCEMTGYSPEELIGKNWCDLLLNAESCETIEQVNLRRRRGVSDRYELKLRRKNGDVLWMLVGGAPIYSDSEKIGGSMGVFTDITERKRIEGQLLHDAFHDGLTNLANRALFMDHLQRAIERGKSRRSNLYAVLFLDFDRFKFINDSLGHLAGDEFLKSVARRLEAATRTSDIVARLGGDEFVVLLSELDTADEAVEIAERIQQHLKKSLKVFGRELFASASIGIALSTSHYENAEEMLRDADIAMYRAKARGRAGCQVFDRRMHEQAANQLLLETELRRALELGEFELHYQPIFSLDDNELVGFESLARWRHARRGVIQPTEFIPAAEESGLILPLGKWILEESCRQLREWQMTLRHTSHLTVSVNLSSKQFAQKDLAAQVAHALESSNLPPRCLKLEITESHVMENSEQAIETMKELRALGVELSLDDFGTGYSSLSYLHRLPASFLKIDRSFVSRMIESGEHREIVSTIIKLAKNLKMKTVAEGIETQEQLAHLNRLNCEFGQGYLFSKPLEAARARKFIEQAKSFFPFSKNAPVINLDVEF